MKAPWPTLGGLIGLAVAGALAVWLPPAVSLALVGGVLTLAVLGARPHWCLALLLLARSSVDGVRDVIQFFPGAWYGFNLAGLFNIVGLGLAFFFLARRLARGQSPLPTRPLQLYALFLLVSAISLPTSLHVAASLKHWTRLAGALGVALLALEIAHQPQRVRLTLRVILLAALPPLAVGLYESFAGGGRFFPGYTNTLFAFRPDGTFDHPATLASFLIVVSALALSALAFGRLLFPRPILWLLVGASLTLLGLTYARAEWLGGAVALGIIGWRHYRRWMPAALLFLVGVLLFSGGVRERLFGWNANVSLVWRQDVWEVSRDLLAHPTLFGSGLETSLILINNIKPTITAPPHNDYLRLALETGWVGGLLFVMVMLATLHTGWRAYRRGGVGAPEAAADMAVLGLTLLAVTVGGAIISLADNYLGYASVQWYIWALVGLLGGESPRAAHGNE